MKPNGRLTLLIGVVLLLPIHIASAEAQPILQVLEPGIGYSRFKQWAIENTLVFENFTKESLIVRDTGFRQRETIRIQTRFCGGDDYSGKASNIVIQQLFWPQRDITTTMTMIHEVVVMQRDYVEFLAGKANADGKLPGTFSGRRDLKDGTDGLAFSEESEKGFWEVGLFIKPESRDVQSALLQTIRRRDSVCQ
jgi:hypothetical protein